jgi:hypothetical protein
MIVCGLNFQWDDGYFLRQFPRTDIFDRDQLDLAIRKCKKTRKDDRAPHQSGRIENRHFQVGLIWRSAGADHLFIGLATIAGPSEIDICINLFYLNGLCLIIESL